MATYFNQPSRTFNEYLLIPGYTDENCIPANVSLKTPLVKFKKGEEPSLSLNIPMTSAIMQSVSNDTLAIALAREGGISFIFGSQSIESEAEMVRKVKNYKAGFVVSDSNLTPENTLADVLALVAQKGHNTIPITDDGTSNGKLLGMVTSRDYRVSRMAVDLKVKEFMTPLEKLITAPQNTTLIEANDIIWDHKLNSIPIIDDEGRLLYMVFRKDYDQHKKNPDELLDSSKRYMVGAGINTLDYEQRVPALIEAGADVLCIDSSEGYTIWQKKTLDYIRKNYGDKVKVGAGNVVDKDGFNFLADCGADFIKVGIGGGSICITREQKGIGRGQATALIEVAEARDEYFKRRAYISPSARTAASCKIIIWLSHSQWAQTSLCSADILHALTKAPPTNSSSTATTSKSTGAKAATVQETGSATTSAVRADSASKRVWTVTFPTQEASKTTCVRVFTK